MRIWKFATTLVVLAAFCGMAAWAQSAPKTVIHFINVKWKAGTTPQQIQSVMDIVKTLPSKYPGITRVWTKSAKSQGQEGFNQAIVMEFKDEDALKKYADSEAQKEFYKVYLPLREESRTHDITN